jgi:hypothetical protein
MRAMNDTATLSARDRDAALAIFNALDASVIAVPTSHGIQTVFRHPLSAMNLARFYNVLRDRSYGTPVRNAARSIIDACINTIRAKDHPPGPTRESLECRARMSIEECRLALRVIGIE